jgi:hypothetical protein
MSRSIERYEPPPQGLAIYEKPLASITPALHFATQLRERYGDLGSTSVAHCKEMAPFASKERAKYLAEFARADAAEMVLSRANNLARPDRKMTSVMVGALLRALDAKSDRDALLGMTYMLESDEIAIASGMWEPLRLTETSLALACSKLIAATATRFVPRPAELHAACVEARNNLLWAEQAARDLVDYTRRCDAVMLEFAPDEWERPYLLKPELQTTRQRMLELHDIYGDGGVDWDWGDDHPNAFREALEREKTKLALVSCSASIPDEPEQMPRLAACEAKPAKRTRKLAPQK